MPIIRALEDGLIRTVVANFVTLDDICQHIHQSRVTGEFEFPELVDARQAVPVSLSVNDLMKIASVVKASLGDQTPGRRAIVVNTDENLRLARAFATLASPWIPVAIFDNMAHAETWLRVRNSPLIRPKSPVPQ